MRYGTEGKHGTQKANTTKINKRIDHLNNLKIDYHKQLNHILVNSTNLCNDLPPGGSPKEPEFYYGKPPVFYRADGRNAKTR